MDCTKKCGFGSLTKDIFYENYLIIAILILGSFLRIYKLGDKSLWMDELIVLNDIMESSSIVTALNSYLYSSPLEALLIYYPIHLGYNPDIFIRLPEAVLGIFSIYLVYLLVKELFNKRLALISAFIFSISPILIWYSQEGRPYSLFVFMSLLSAYYFIRTLADSDYKNSFLFILSTILLLLTHSFAVLLFLVEIFYLISILILGKLKICRQNVSNFRPFNLIVSFLIICALFLPYFINSLGFKLVQEGLPFGDAGSFSKIYQTFGSFTVAPGYFPIAEIFGEYNLIFFAAVVIFFISLLVCGFVYSLKENRLNSLFLVLWLSVPIALCTFVNILTGRVVIVERYLLFCIVPYLIFISDGILLLNDVFISRAPFKNINFIKNKGLKSNFIAIIILILMASFYIPMDFYGYDIEKQDWKGTIGFLNNHSNSNDRILFIGSGSEDIFGYYYTGSSEIFFLTADTETIEDEIINNSDRHDKTWLVISPHNGVPGKFEDFFDSYTLEKKPYDRRYIPDSGDYILRGAVYST